MPIRINKNTSLKDEGLYSSNQYIISILCMQDGFSFLVYDKDRNKFVALETFDLECVAQNMQDETFNLHRNVAWKILSEESTVITHFRNANVFICLEPNQSTWMPLALFDEHEKERYIRLNFGKPEGTIFYQTNNHIDAVCVYTAYQTAVDCLKQLFSNAQIHPLQNVLTNHFYRIAKKMHLSPTVFCFASKTTLHIQVFSDKKMIFSNHFPYQSKQDGAYYILNIYDKLDLNPERIPIYFSGEIMRDSNLFMFLKKYINYMDVVTENNSFSYSYVFDDVHKSTYYHLFNAVSCALLEDIGKVSE